MTPKQYKKLYISFSLLFTGMPLIHAQEIKTAEQVSSEIEVIRPYKPILAEAVKLRRSPDLDNLKTYRAKFNYTLVERKLELNTDIQKLQAQQLADERVDPLVNNYVKGAIGNLTTFMAEAYAGTGKDEALQAAAYFKHFSQMGALNKQNESNQQLGLFGRSIGKKATLNGRINYNRHGVYFYGIDPAKPTLNLNPEKQVFNFVDAEGEIVKRFSNDENAWSYAAKAGAYLLSDRFDARENLFSLSAYLNKRAANLNFGLAAAAELGKTKDVSTSFSNNLLRLNPHIKFQANDLKITGGINFVQEFGSNTTSHIFPAITADFILIPDYLQLFAEVKGDVNRNSLKSFTDENPFLNSNIHFQNSVEKLSVSIGIKGTGGPGFGYKARFYSRKITDMPLFVNNFVNSHKFDVIYDFGDMQLTGVEGEISIQVSDQLKWTGKVNIDDYSPASETEAWYKPSLKVNSNLTYQINKKLTFEAAVNIQDDSKAKLFFMNPIPTFAPGYPPLPDPSNETVVNLKGFVDLGAGASYKINSQFGVFVKINNLLNTKYSKFMYYNANGLNAYGGISYSF